MHFKWAFLWHIKFEQSRASNFSPTSYLVGVACIEPPIPPNETHSIRHYSGGTTVPFGWVADYSCEEGYYFGEDFNMTHYNLTCYKNGSWEEPEHWKQCYQPSGEQMDET